MEAKGKDFVTVQLWESKEDGRETGMRRQRRKWCKNNLGVNGTSGQKECINVKYRCDEKLNGHRGCGLDRVQGHSYTKDFLNLSHKFSLTGARQVTWGSKAVTEASHRRNPTPYGGSSIQLQLTDGWQGRIWTQVVRSSDFLFSREAIELIQDMFIKTVGQKSWQEKIGT